MNQFLGLVAALVAFTGMARADGDHHDDGGGSGVRLTTLPAGNVHCPFGGVQISTGSQGDRDKEKGKGDKDRASHKDRGDKDRDRKDHDHEGRGAQVAYVCNGSPGPQGTPGIPGPQGPPGPPATGGTTPAYTFSNAGQILLPPGGVPTTVATVDVPAGNYVVEAKAQLALNGEGAAGEIDCKISDSTGTTIDQQRVIFSGVATTALLGPLATPAAADTITMTCSTPQVFSGDASNIELAAVQVSPLVSAGAGGAVAPTKR